MRRFLTFIYFICCSLALFCQNGRNITYNLFAGYGYVAKTNDFMRGYNVDSTDIKSIKSFAFEVQKDVDGSKQWHHLYKNFHYGAGLFHGVFNYSKNIGNPWGLYAFMGFMPVSTEKWQFKTDIALGISGIWDGYSSENYYNIAVSTPVECYIHARLSLLYNINDNWHAGLSGSFIHFSNGCIKRPNKGINIITPSVNIAFNPEKTFKTDVFEKIPFIKNVQHLISVYDGIKGTYVGYDKFIDHYAKDTIRDTVRDVHMVFGVQYREMYSLSFTQNLGWGFDVSYNNVIDRTRGFNYIEPQDNRKWTLNRMTVSAFASYEYCIDKFSVVLEPIFYLYKPQKVYFPRFSQRIALRYQFCGGWFYQLGLRAYQFTKADYLEGTVGYRFKYKM
ncbi:MAG: acyloxyacyl hydrolase [Bacteroidales bacterium]|nr:acyloxyacyl hydrolase [Bacteroidales bacterium]